MVFKVVSLTLKSVTQTSYRWVARIKGKNQQVPEVDINSSGEAT